MEKSDQKRSDNRTESQTQRGPFPVIRWDNSSVFSRLEFAAKTLAVWVPATQVTCLPGTLISPKLSSASHNSNQRTDARGGGGTQWGDRVSKQQSSCGNVSPTLKGRHWGCGQRRKRPLVWENSSGCSLVPLPGLPCEALRIPAPRDRPSLCYLPHPVHLPPPASCPLWVSLSLLPHVHAGGIVGSYSCGTILGPALKPYTTVVNDLKAS